MINSRRCTRRHRYLKGKSTNHLDGHIQIGLNSRHTTSVFRHFINEIPPFITISRGAGFALHPITYPIVTEILQGRMARGGVDLSYLP